VLVIQRGNKVKIENKREQEFWDEIFTLSMKTIKGQMPHLAAGEADKALTQRRMRQ
jgi:hypothetical protein